MEPTGRVIDGRNLSKEDLHDKERVRNLGKQVGILHRFARNYTPVHSLVRPEYGIERNAQMLDQIRYGLEIGTVRLSDLDIVEQVLQIINRRLDELGRDDCIWGLIHADLNMSNIIVADHGYSFIVFVYRVTVITCLTRGNAP